MNQHDALYKVARAYPGGIEALAQRMQVSVPVLYNKLRPGVDTHHTSFEQVSEIVEHCVQACVPDALAPIHAMNWRHGLVAFTLPQSTNADSSELIQNVCNAVKEFGDVATCVSLSANDSFIDDKELARIEKEFQEVHACLAELRSRIHTKVAEQRKGRVRND